MRGSQSHQPTTTPGQMDTELVTRLTVGPQDLTCPWRVLHITTRKGPFNVLPRTKAETPSPRAGHSRNVPPASRSANVVRWGQTRGADACLFDANVIPIPPNTRRCAKLTGTGFKRRRQYPSMNALEMPTVVKRRSNLQSPYPSGQTESDTSFLACCQKTVWEDVCIFEDDLPAVRVYMSHTLLMPFFTS